MIMAKHCKAYPPGLNCLIPFLLVLALIPGLCNAQSDRTGQRGKRFSVIASGGIYINPGLTSDVENVFIKSGLGQTEPGSLGVSGFGPDQPHPVTGKKPLTSTLQLMYNLNSKYAVGLQYHETTMRRTEGYGAEETGVAPALAVDMSYMGVTSFSSVLFTRASDGKAVTQAGIGPSIHFTESNVKYAGNVITEEETKFGFIIVLGFEAPAESMVFFDFSLDYKYVGKTNAGPYDFSAERINTGLGMVEIQNSYFAIRLGIGFRL